MPEGVPIRVMTSQSMVLSGEGAKVSEITPRKSDNPFFIFSVAPEEPSVCKEKPAEEASGPGTGYNLGYGVWRGEGSGAKVYRICGDQGSAHDLSLHLWGWRRRSSQAFHPSDRG